MNENIPAVSHSQSETGKNIPETPLSHDLLIGEKIAEFMSKLKSTGETILDLIESASLKSNINDILKEYIQEYSNQTCRIAIIGQMKSGKSTFINALAGRKNFLPSDVNPWTTVVTRLHFGTLDQEQETAEFCFFDENEWQRISETGGKLRELTQRFLPGFQTERMSRQLSEMRSRAQRRLGENFHQLLGKAHVFDQVSPEILKQYVCAGDFWDQENLDNCGNFSDITESADLFLKTHPFALPATIIDTPGTNDPFFVRDEITCQNLNNADIFIIILHAQQALSMTDIGLLKILQGLKKDRIIIFINRIDQLNNYREETRDITEHTKYILQQEFPNINFPIIVGSALWGQKALDDSTNLADFNIDEIISQPLGYRERTELFEKSGIPQAAEAISQLMLIGNKRYPINKIISNLKLATQAILAISKNHIKHLAPKLQKSAEPSQEEASENPNLHKQILHLEDLVVKCNEYYDQYTQKLDDLKNSILDFFGSCLNKIIMQFAFEEGQKLANAMNNGQTKKVWTVETHHIRSQLETELSLISKEAAEQLTLMQEIEISELKSMLKNTSEKIEDNFLVFENTIEKEPRLSALAINDTVTLDLDQSWWKEWWSKKQKQNNWAQEIEDLIKQDFFPIANKLVEAVKTELENNIQESIRNYYTMNQTVINIIQQHIEELKGQYHNNQVLDNADIGPVAANNADFHQIKKTLKKSLENISKAEKIIEYLKQIESEYTSYTSK